jgi:hypothetical protein
MVYATLLISDELKATQFYFLSHVPTCTYNICAAVWFNRYLGVNLEYFHTSKESKL